MKQKAIHSFTSLMVLLILAGFLEATNVKVIVQQNTAGNPRIAQAEVCLLVSDGSIRKQIAGNQGTTVFSNVSIGNTTVRAHKSGFNQGTVTLQLESVPEEVVTVNLNSGSAAPLPCNLQTARDITGLFTIIPANPIPPGASATYRFNVNNVGQSNASNVQARIDLPAGFGFPTFHNQSTLTCGTAGGGGAPFRITCSPASINAGTSRLVIFSSQTPSNIINTQNFIVQAVVDPSNTVVEGNENNNTTSTTTTVSIQAAADLRLDVSGSDTQVFLYDEYDYLLKVKNAGLAGAGNVIAKITLPPEASFVRLENNTFNSCPREGQVINCVANSMIPNTERSVRIVAKPKQTTPGGRQMLMSVGVDPDNEVVETNEINNTAFVSTTTDIAPVDFEVSELSESVGPFTDNRFVLIRVRNNSSNPALSTTVRLTLSSNLCTDHTDDCPAPKSGFPEDGGLCAQVNNEGCGANPCPINALSSGQQSPRKEFSVKCSDSNVLQTTTANLTACVDPNNLLPETNESNNCKSISVRF